MRRTAAHIIHDLSLAHSLSNAGAAGSARGSDVGSILVRFPRFAHVPKKRRGVAHDGIINVATDSDYNCASDPVNVNHFALLAVTCCQTWTFSAKREIRPSA
jgi:hypothetical protein